MPLLFENLPRSSRQNGLLLYLYFNGIFFKKIKQRYKQVLEVGRGLNLSSAAYHEQVISRL